MRRSFTMTLKKMLRSGVNRAGFDVIRLHRSPKRTLLGLAELDIGAVIDVGANQGQFARLISGFFPHAQLYCFEPLPDQFEQLSAWGGTQDGRVHSFQVALGDQEGQVEMRLHEQHTPSSSLLAATDTCHQLYPQTRAERMVSVRVSTLDRELADVVERLPPRVLLKLDVQGFEDRVLRGAERVLDKCKAVVLEVCIDPLYEGQADFFSLAGMLQKSGFRYAGNLDQAYGEDGRVVYLDAVFVRQ
ncbi:MAG: FkbM family methyltransferase [Abyssibacter sp.]|nr:FkbM family methyltransferase [Abyssibacter sp.]MCK5857895.1 FkbM family methyltransferase [Abyssibacter sp.]